MKAVNAAGVEDSQPIGRTLLDDIVADILRRLDGELADERLAAIERDVRRDWGGERPYIAKAGESARQVQSARDERIRQEHRRGERVELLARRYGISSRRIRKILAA